MQTQEKIVRIQSGWPILAGVIVLPLLMAGVFIVGAVLEPEPETVWVVLIFVGAALLAVGWFLTLWGFYTLQPNQAAVLILFGKYVGTDKSSGFHWANPFFKKEKVSLRARNLNMEPIKVNDLMGNPIEIAAVVVWNVDNTAEAVFDVDSFEHYVEVQSESALRHLAMAYPYDEFGDGDMSLRGSPDEISKALQEQIQERVATAGVHIIEARLSHLAYAQEIAGAMLKRQQAEAIVAARARIVEGAVGMVEDALKHLTKANIIELDEERKAAMVSNLLVVLCGHSDAQPVINTGTLYSG